MLIPALPVQAASKLSGYSFLEGHCFSEGLAAVYKDKKYGYINKKGKYVIEPQYADAGDFSEGIAVVQTEDGEWNFIDQTGAVVVK